MSKADIVSYRVLILDDQEAPSGWGAIQKTTLELDEFEVDHFTSWDAAKAGLAEREYDFFFVDLNLQGTEDGLDALKQLRSQGYNQPIVIVTANENCLDTPISHYTEALASGPVSFIDKMGENFDIVEIARDVSNRVDPLRRTLRLMREAGLTDEEFWVDGETVTINDLLGPKPHSKFLARALKESLNALLLRLALKGGLKT